MKCSYCYKEIPPGTGIMYVRKNGSISYYCSNRCFKFDVVYRKKARVKAQPSKAKSQ